MTALRKDVEWMQDVPFSCLQETLRSLQTAFKNFFDRVKKGQRVSEGRNPFGYPISANSGRPSKDGDGTYVFEDSTLPGVRLTTMCGGKIYQDTVTNN